MSVYTSIAAINDFYLIYFVHSSQFFIDTDPSLNSDCSKDKQKQPEIIVLVVIGLQTVSMHCRKTALFLFGFVLGIVFVAHFKTARVCHVREFTKVILGGKHKRTTQNNDEPRLLLVGIITAKKNLDTRVKAALDTWVKSIPGKVLFFSGEDSNETARHSNYSLIALQGVKNTYPPQKKSFLMLKYMHDFYSERYEWFMRADDDVYIIGDKLGPFLASINTSKLHYIGHPGQGKKQEEGKLGLTQNHPYCLGGTGVILSRATLAEIAPHISFCLKHLHTSHEDTEIGRCISSFVGISCSKSYEVKAQLDI